jgi:hypothetical protein
VKSRLSAVILVVAVSTGFYLLLIDTVSSPELYAMAGIVVLASAAFMASREQGFIEAAIKGRWLLRAWRPLLGVPTQIVLVSREAFTQCVHPQRVRGTFRTVAFAAGDRPEDIGRRALSEALGSLAPNTIVIGVDTEREQLLVHQLYRGGSPEDLDVLRLG